MSGGHHPEKDGPHYIEERLLVYIKVQNGRWVVDGADIYTETDRGALNEACECGDKAGCDAARKAADAIPLPDAEELAELLRHAAAEGRAALAAQAGGVTG